MLYFKLQFGDSDVKKICLPGIFILSIRLCTFQFNLLVQITYLTYTLLVYNIVYCMMYMSEIGTNTVYENLLLNKQLKSTEKSIISHN